MRQNSIKVIHGGLTADLKVCDKAFCRAYVTNTRLMGVLAIHAEWICTGDNFRFPLHQFFYIDCEEAGLETYRSFRGQGSSEMELYEQGLVGGLGSDRIPVSEAELRWLLNHWRIFNEKHSLPLPAKQDEYSFIFEGPAELSYEDRRNVLDKVCVDITSDYQLVNYFLMRCFGRDYEAAGRLTDLTYDFPLDLYDSYIKATFCKNSIDLEKKYGDGSSSYICDSLIEMGGKHKTVISRVVIKDMKVIGFEHCDSFDISSAEAAMMLKKTEFTNVYEFLLEGDDLEENLGEFIVGLNTIMTTHSNGRLFMAFKSTNDHVCERVFMLSNDVRGVYYLTDYGQLILMAYTPEDVSRLEAKLALSPLGQHIVPTARYEFLEPVFFEFINSGFEDFEDFLDLTHDR
ncbi:MAG: hypothetical protein MJ161_05455 [Clostridia bacterium]|nr:hypothetical protein [Clostridia bacterium]